MPDKLPAALLRPSPLESPLIRRQNPMACKFAFCRALTLEISAMKTTLFALCFLCATAAVGQSSAGVSALNSQPQMLEFPSHAQHASQQPMGPGQDLREASGSTSARGERPLWEVAPASRPVPLGDTARTLRKEHAAAKKAEIVWNN